MNTSKLSRKNLIYTSRSGTTVFVNYSESLQLLEVKYRTENRVYHYLQVEPAVWKEYKNQIITGGSSGVFLNTRIKPFYQGVEVTNGPGKPDRQKK